MTITMRDLERDALRTMMDFDHVVQVHADGTVTDAPGMYAPEVYEIDGKVQETGDWSLLNGYSGQYGYGGPVMHPSEYLGGRMADDILATPGFYVTVVVTDANADTDNGEDDVSGWAVAYREVTP